MAMEKAANNPPKKMIHFAENLSAKAWEIGPKNDKKYIDISS